jgi:VHL beta domain
MSKSFLRAALSWLSLLASLVLVGNVTIVRAAGEVPEPHSSCESEPTSVSTEGVVQATLTVINVTDATFQLYWLDYDGERVYYQDSPPSSTLEQATWLTHPWILTDPDGTCYLLVVINAVQQTMTIGTTTGETLSTPRPTATPPTPRPAVADTGPTATPVPAQGTTDPAREFPTPLVVGALAMMGVLVGVLAATGRLPFVRTTRPPGT